MGLVVTDKTVIDLIKRYRSPIASGTPSAIFGIPILGSAPAALANLCRPWIDLADYNLGTEGLMEGGIQLVFPDGTNKGIFLPFSYKE